MEALEVFFEIHTDLERESPGLDRYTRQAFRMLPAMDRPAILTLVDEAGNSHDVVLTASHGETAELSIGGVLVTHPVVEIGAAWFGDFTLLWRPPTGSVVSLVSGSRGPAVTWLRNSLASIDERYASTDPQSDVFDAELDRIVRDFQRDHRLDVDGVAGQQTQIIINSQLAVESSASLGPCPRFSSVRAKRASSSAVEAMQQSPAFISIHAAGTRGWLAGGGRSS